MKLTKRAFSLIELSIVILVIGIILVGIVTSQKVIHEFRITKARTETESSQIVSIPGLKLWLEATLERSFIAGEVDDNANISTWKNITPQISSTNQAYQSSVDSCPNYISDCINSLPCIRFNGSSDYFSFDGSVLAGTDFSIFIVEQRRSNSSPNYFIGGSSYGTNLNMHLGYRNSSQITFAQYANDINITTASYTTPIPKIHDFIYGANSAEGKYHYLNGAKSSFSTSGASPFVGLTSFNGATFGRYLGNYYNGDIAEILIFDRAVNAEERQLIENYLSKKWKIELD